MENGLVKPRSEGVPQGGPLSPLLSNIVLTELDRELEKRGHKFCRYADDCNIYVKSEEAAKRVLESVTTKYLEGGLKLRVNRDKSGTFRPYESVFLGYTFHRYNPSRPIVAPKSVKRLKEKLKVIYRRCRGTSLSYTIEKLTQLLRGWRNYFQLDTRKEFFENLDINIRTHLRCLIWRAWKRPRTRAREMHKRGLDENAARLQRSRSMVECSFTTYADMHPERFICQVGIVFSEASGYCLNETPYAEPHVRCCGRRRAISRNLPDAII